MARKYGPTRGELWFRLVFSVLGLAGVGLALAIHGMPGGPGLVEVVGIPVLLFGGTAAWSARRLIRRDHPEPPARR